MSKERELLKRWFNDIGIIQADIKLLRDTQELLAQPEQEPVAWITEWVQRYRHNDTPIIDRAVSFTKGDAPAVPNPNYMPLYTAPQKREPEDDQYYNHIKEHRQECEADFKEQQSEERWYANSLGDDNE